MHPALAHERRLLAVFISRSDPRDQSVLLGKARWDGTALWLDAGDVSEAVLILGPGAEALLLPATSELRSAFAEGTEYGVELGALVRDADFISCTEVMRMPFGALSVPGACSQAFVPSWKVK